jgi:hypothetical protein
MGFLLSDVGTGGIRTLDGVANADSVPPYFYHYAIAHDDGLASALSGYPGYASISYPGYTVSIAIDAFLAYWAYSGNQECLDRAIALADWLLPRRTPPGDVYGNWVYSTQTDGVMGGGFDGEAIMSDKPAMYALRCLRLAEITGETRFHDAAVEIADTYVATQMTGPVEDAGRWPFRVRPSDGLVTQDYTSHLIPAVRLLQRLGVSESNPSYTAAATAAFDWLINNPLEATSVNYQRWEGFYEDIGPEAAGLRDHYSAENTLAELLVRDAPGDLARAIDIWNWSNTRYLSPDDKQNGWGIYDPAILEWDAWPNTTYAATGQWAYVSLLLDARTQGLPEHDPQWKPRAIEALHTMTYGQGDELLPADDRMITTVRELSHPLFGIETWYEQNFNSIIYMLLSFDLATELAPSDQEHLLGFDDTELQSISYGSEFIVSDWSSGGVCRFKLSREPFHVDIGGVRFENPTIAPSMGWEWDAATQICTVYHDGSQLRIAMHLSVTTPPLAPAPLAQLGQPYPNPFNPRVLIPYSLGESGATLSIVDLRGRHVRLLSSALSQAQQGVAVWNGRDDAGQSVASGNYIVRLIATDGVQTRRISLVR